MRNSLHITGLKVESRFFLDSGSYVIKLMGVFPFIADLKKMNLLWSILLKFQALKVDTEGAKMVTNRPASPKIPLYGYKSDIISSNVVKI